MLVVADINTLWRSRPFEAMAHLNPVLGLAPKDRWLAARSHQRPWGSRRDRRGRMEVLHVVLAMRWAGRRAETALPRLWKTAESCAATLGNEVSGVVATSPHYLPLCQRLRAAVPVFYYCSDDYRSYSGWDQERTIASEGDLVRLAKHSFFVSEELRRRALAEYGVPPSATSVSMNAADESFLRELPTDEIAALMASHPQIRRPVVGVVGGINDRLDFALLGQVAQMNSVGTLLLVGPVARESHRTVADLSAVSRRVVLAGPQEHERLPAWMQLLDVALIPYRTCEFNRFCSPMRLFDHLAAGRPIVATSACPQVAEFAPHVAVSSSREQFLRLVESAIVSPYQSDPMVTCARRNTWSCRAQMIAELIR